LYSALPEKAKVTEQMTLHEAQRWRNLRDNRGKLMARIEPVRLILEIRRNDMTFEFDLRDYIDYLRAIATEPDR
jgi:hypothetical protein